MSRKQAAKRRTDDVKKRRKVGEPKRPPKPSQAVIGNGVSQAPPLPVPPTADTSEEAPLPAAEPEERPEMARELVTVDDGGEDFGALLDEKDADIEGGLQPGDQIEGRIVILTKDLAFVDLGGKSEGSIPLRELSDDEGKVSVKEGDPITAWVVGMRHGIELSTALHADAQDEAQLRAAFDSHIPIDGKVSGVNQGGLEVKIGGRRAFCPISQVDTHHVEDASVFIGRTLRFRIVRYEEGRDIVLSRRAQLESEAAEQAAETKKTLMEGAVLSGRIKNIKDFGIFVDLGGVEGLVPRSEISWERIEDLEKAFVTGDRVRVKVLRIDWEEERITLSMKALRADPWHETAERFEEGRTYTGRVARITEFGAFVELDPGFEGLAHISELAWRRINHPSEVLSEDEQVQVRVLSVDAERKRLALSVRMSEGDPWEAADQRFSAGTTVEGEVERIERFGVFVRLAPGVTALLPRSEIECEPNDELRRLFAIGRKTKAKVLHVDLASRRISLSQTAAKEDAERADMDAWHAAAREEKKQLDEGPSLMAQKLMAALQKSKKG